MRLGIHDSAWLEPTVNTIGVANNPITFAARNSMPPMLDPFKHDLALIEPNVRKSYARRKAASKLESVAED